MQNSSICESSSSNSLNDTRLDEILYEVRKLNGTDLVHDNEYGFTIYDDKKCPIDLKKFDSFDYKILDKPFYKKLISELDHKSNSLFTIERLIDYIKTKVNIPNANLKLLENEIIKVFDHVLSKRVYHKHGLAYFSNIVIQNVPLFTTEECYKKFIEDHCICNSKSVVGTKEISKKFDTFISEHSEFKMYCAVSTGYTHSKFVLYPSFREELQEYLQQTFGSTVRYNRLTKVQHERTNCSYGFVNLDLK
jgi:hypothetical protein